MSKRRPVGVKSTSAVQNAVIPDAAQQVVGRTFTARDLLAFACLLCVNLLVYSPAFRGTYVWDDLSNVTPPGLRSLHGLWQIWFDLRATSQYYPLVQSAFWLEHFIWGDNTIGYHLVNVVLHTVSAGLVVLIVRRLALPGAWLAGCIFALHPVCVESVAWITEQKNTLSCVWYLTAILTYLLFDQTRSKSKYFLALFLFLLALASKSATTPLPGVLLVIVWWRYGRIDWRRDVLPLVPFAGLAISSGLLTFYVEKVFVRAQGSTFALSPIQHLLVATRVPWYYAFHLLWPVNLMFFYPHWSIDPGVWWQYLFPAGLVAVTIAFGLLARRNRGPLAGLLIFVGTLVPVLGFLHVFYFRYSYIADHFEYLASLGIIVPVAAAVTIAGRRLHWKRELRLALPAAVLLGLAALSWRQSGMYIDVETLYRESLARNPDSWLAHDNLGTLLFQMPGQRFEAISHFKDAIRADPNYWEAHVSMGNALLEMPGRLDDAIAEYQTAVRLEPDSVRTHTGLGTAMLKAGRTEEAITQFQAALQTQPDSATAHSDLANALTRVPGRMTDAIAEYQAAIHANPDFAEAHNDLGHVLAVSGRLPEAIAEFQTALRIRPNYWGAHSNLGTALLQMPGRLPDAAAEFQTVVRLQPDSAMAHANLGYVFSRMPDRLPDAIREYEAALRLDPNPQLREMVDRLRAGIK
jgi:protein O-mannosyl-transferase